MTIVDICNSALIKLGQNPIASIEETGKAAVLCKQRIGIVIDMVLYEHTWNFATNRVVLSQRIDTPTYGYAYWYDLPADYLRVVSTNIPRNCKYKIEGRKLLTDVSTVSMEYIKTVEDTGYFTPSFCEAVAFKLASDLAYALVQSSSKGEEMRVAYERHLATCRTFDAQEGNADEIEADEYIDAHIFGEF